MSLRISLCRRQKSHGSYNDHALGNLGGTANVMFFTQWYHSHMAWLLLHLQQVAETQRVAGAAEAAGMFGEHFVCFTIDVLRDPI